MLKLLLQKHTEQIVDAQAAEIAALKGTQR